MHPPPFDTEGGSPIGTTTGEPAWMRQTSQCQLGMAITVLYLKLQVLQEETLDSLRQRKRRTSHNLVAATAWGETRI